MAAPFPVGPLVLPAPLWDQMMAHVLAARPQEGCGLLAGQAGRPVKFYACTNVHPQPVIRYRIDDRELFHAHREMDAKGWDLLAIFHSHPASRAYPSQTDVAQAHYPDSLYLIVSLSDPRRPDLHGYWIRDGLITEHPVQVESAA